jgi:hypothetical protein
MTKPGHAGPINMGKNKNNNKNLVKLTPEQIANMTKNFNERQKNIPSQLNSKTENIKYDKVRMLENDMEGTKFLIMHRTDENKTMRDISPILLETAIKNSTQNGKVDCRVLKSGDILIKTENVKQAQQLIKITSIMDSTIEVYEHKTMNSCKGVIRAYELQNENKETLLDYLKPQNVTDLHFHQRTINNKTINTGLVFVTFGTNVLPEELTVGYLRLRVRPYIPTPMRCYACHKYGHLSKHCQIKDAPTCYNCIESKHIHNTTERCANTPRCVNCNEEGHNSYNRNCTEYKRQVDILTIKVTQNVSMAEAVKRSNINKKSYAQVTATVANTQCTCTHCDYHKNATRTSSLPLDSTQHQQLLKESTKRTRERNKTSLELSTDEEQTKKKRVVKDVLSEQEEEEMTTE